MDEKTLGISLVEIPSPEEVIENNLELDEFDRTVVSINSFPDYVAESDNPNVLIKGRWLERGGSAWWISTAGTGKSIACIQMAYKWGCGLDFSGLQPYRNIRSWIIQSEDSDYRIVIDREDVVAELTERHPEIDWKSVGENMVKFVKIVGKVGVDFIDELDRLLGVAKKKNQMPDVVVINPFMAYVGGPVTDGGYVTPFLRGGDIGNKHTDGLQAVLQRHNVATLIFHHTPKPPTNKELDGWLNNMFPEYQGAGSSDITNWGRSFITMMKVSDKSKIVCLIAGKNGNEIGWEEIKGARRHYMAWSDGTSINGGYRHAWRDLNEQEYDETVGKLKSECEEDIETVAASIAEMIKQDACKLNDVESRYEKTYGRKLTRSAKEKILNVPARYHITVKKILIGKKWTTYLGLVDKINELVKLDKQKYDVEESKRREKTISNGFVIPS